MTTRNLRNIHKNHNCKARYDRLTARQYELAYRDDPVIRRPRRGWPGSIREVPEFQEVKCSNCGTYHWYRVGFNHVCVICGEGVDVQ